MAVKLTKIELYGFRGVKEQLVIHLPSAESLLLYGENGSGKSSLTDGLEWFYHDRVGHLASQEIGRNGIPALRHKALRDDDDDSRGDGNGASHKRGDQERATLSSTS